MIARELAHSFRRLWREHPLAVVVATAGVLFIIRFIALAAFRVGYPYQLEWMEGGVLLQVRRILDGRRMYVEPSLSYIPFIYTPLYFYASAAASKVVGFGFLPLRLVSFVSTLATFWIVFDIVRRETGRAWPGIVAAGLYAAAFDMTGQWMDLARVDSLALCLMLGSIHLLHYWGERRLAIAAAAGALAAMAFLTKQTVAPIVGLMMLYELALCPRRMWPAPAAAAIVGGLALAWLQFRSDGWFGYYAFDLPRGHELLRPYIVAFWTVDMKAIFPIGLVLAACAPALLWLQRGPRACAFHLLLAASLIVMAWGSRIHIGGWTNVLIPAIAALAILTGITLGLAAAQPKLYKHVPALLCFAAGIQFWSLHEPESKAIPTAEDRKAGERFETLFASLPGEVFAPGSGYIAARVGKQPTVHTAASIDVLRAPESPTRARYKQEVVDAIRNRRFDAVILDSFPGFFGFEKEIHDAYRVDRVIFPAVDAFAPLTGVPMRPEVIMVPK